MRPSVKDSFKTFLGLASGKPDGTLSAWGVRGPWGRTWWRGSCSDPQISQSASRWSSARARETGTGGGRGCQSSSREVSGLDWERWDRSEVMLIHPQQVHESSTNASSACWRPRQRSCPSSADRKRLQPRGHGRNDILKKTRPSVIYSFRICSFSWSAERDSWLHRDANQEQNKDERLCGDQHTSPPLGYEAKIECTCRPFLPYARGVSQVCKIH